MDVDEDVNVSVDVDVCVGALWDVDVGVRKKSELTTSAVNTRCCFLRRG